MTTFEDILSRDGRLIYKTRGTSMLPMLHQNRDLVVIEPPLLRLERFDVALYKRGKSYVLHRVIEVKDGYYLIRGDNTFTLERVPDSAVIGVLTAFNRKGRQFSVTSGRYLRYVHFWNRIYPLRHFWFCVIGKLKAVMRKLGIMLLLKSVFHRNR